MTFGHFFGENVYRVKNLQVRLALNHHVSRGGVIRVIFCEEEPLEKFLPRVTYANVPSQGAKNDEISKKLKILKTV